MYLPKNYQYTSHVRGKIFYVKLEWWSKFGGHKLQVSDKHTLVWSETLKDVHSHSANKSAGALIETPVSILQIAPIGSCVRDLVPLPYLGNQYTAECTGRTAHPDWKNIYNVCEDFENLQAIFCWYFF